MTATIHDLATYRASRRPNPAAEYADIVRAFALLWANAWCWWL